MVQDLASRLKGEVRFDRGSRALYATDGSNYRQVPIGAVIPRDIEDVIHAIEVCRAYDVPVLNRGGGTSLAGQCCNAAVVVDMSKYRNRVIWLDPARKLARVEPGIILDDLRHAAEQHHLTFGPDPATHSRCTLGGMSGNNSCGIHSVMAGRTADNIEELDILTYDGVRMTVGRTSEEELENIVSEGGRRGEIYRNLRDLRDRYADEIRARYPRIPRRVSGYNLDNLLPENGFHVARALIGSESTLATILEITTNLVNSPPMRSLLVLGYADIYTAGDHIMEVLEAKPIGLEGIDDVFINDMKLKNLHPRDLNLMPEGTGWLLVEFGGETREEAKDRARELMDTLKRKSHPPAMKLFDNPAEERMIWEVRESGLGATARVPGQKDNWEGWEDSAVPPARVGDYLRDLRGLLKKYGYKCSLYGHLGDGCIHTRIDFDLKTAEGIRHFRSFISEAVDTVLSYGGSLSGEHGDGQSRAEFLPRMFGDRIMRAFHEFKSIWDPRWKMNPGKVVDPYRIDQNLRLGSDYRPPQYQTHFKFLDDQNSWSRATERCVGVGECRRTGHGTMCPSFMVTREEMHSTRGRARLLFEMMQGDPIEDGWRSPHVREALDLCLSCKGCKSDCPVNVDMATMKAEFLSHYYAGRLRPRSAYASGLIHWWSRLAEHLPEFANFVTQTPGLSAVSKALAGYSQQRRMPAFAARTFKQWFRTHTPRNPQGPRVLLWADTFNNHFHPDVARSAVEVLEAAGFKVVVKTEPLCCGRPLYDYGMLDLAKSLLHRTLHALERELTDGTPMVGLEPSCVSVFRDEMPDLLAGNEDAKRLSGQTFLLSEFLEQKAPDFPIPKLSRKAVVHGHCHHKSVLGFQAEQKVLERLGLDFEVLDSGCCGMAGAFGFEKEHYEISMRCGERALLPAVRAASPETIIVADGFSCREQIAQTTSRRALHLTQVLSLALHQEGIPRHLPESRFPPEPADHAKAGAALMLGAGVLIAGSALASLLRRR